MKLGIKRVIAAVLLSSLVFALAGCSEKEEPSAASSEQEQSNAVAAESEGSSLVVEITMERGGVIKVELDREAAPLTVDNFVKLVEEEFYDGLVFHRVVEGFMIQGGDNGQGGPGYSIKGEFADNGWENPIKHTRGIISMARTPDPDSAGSQFFIMHGDAPFLDGGYAAFGHVTEGMDVVDRIATGPVNGELAADPEVIQSIRMVD